MCPRTTTLRNGACGLVSRKISGGTRSGQAPSTQRCSVQGRLLRLGSGQAPSTQPAKAGARDFLISGPFCAILRHLGWPFDSAQGRLLRPSAAPFRAGSFDSAQGRLLRRLGSGQAPSTQRSGQAPSTRLRAGSFDPALLRSGQAPSTRLAGSFRAGSFSGQAPSTRLRAGSAGCSGLALILTIVVRCIRDWEGRGVSWRVNAEGAENAEFYDGLGSLRAPHPRSPLAEPSIRSLRPFVRSERGWRKSIDSRCDCLG